MQRKPLFLIIPVIAIIGPHSEAHLQASLEALEPAIGPEEARWLNLEM